MNPSARQAGKIGRAALKQIFSQRQTVPNRPSRLMMQGAPKQQGNVLPLRRAEAFKQEGGLLKQIETYAPESIPRAPRPVPRTGGTGGARQKGGLVIAPFAAAAVETFKKAEAEGAKEPRQQHVSPTPEVSMAPEEEKEEKPPVRINIEPIKLPEASSSGGSEGIWETLLGVKKYFLDPLGRGCKVLYHKSLDLCSECKDFIVEKILSRAYTIAKIIYKLVLLILRFIWLLWKYRSLIPIIGFIWVLLYFFGGVIYSKHRQLLPLPRSLSAAG